MTPLRDVETRLGTWIPVPDGAPVWRITNDVIADTVTVAIHECLRTLRR